MPIFCPDQLLGLKEKSDKNMAIKISAREIKMLDLYRSSSWLTAKI